MAPAAIGQRDFTRVAVEEILEVLLFGPVAIAGMPSFDFPLRILQRSIVVPRQFCKEAPGAARNDDLEDLVASIQRLVVQPSDPMDDLPRPVEMTMLDVSESKSFRARACRMDDHT